ncbi:hypothetical protein BP00DRAFT_83645 [Aspergillus indologenus CBS 114.80]|uniref:Uncharacterized protein n=1 Tax=Aspergillus indologenus CBS 114.80 TaxID=1450541 RepID=A0A2V5JE72_9EURO|nr:hypothetical protein BP00DRAFT_83645 [Aspergillus indologenus CBS 114.80]
MHRHESWFISNCTTSYMRRYCTLLRTSPIPSRLPFSHTNAERNPLCPACTPPASLVPPPALARPTQGRQPSREISTRPPLDCFSIEPFILTLPIRGRPDQPLWRAPILPLEPTMHRGWMDMSNSWAQRRILPIYSCSLSAQPARSPTSQGPTTLSPSTLVSTLHMMII